jgi:hypothetical protein
VREGKNLAQVTSKFLVPVARQNPRRDPFMIHGQKHTHFAMNSDGRAKLHRTSSAVIGLSLA